MYENELNALRAKNRFRERKIYRGFADFASNDYLGFASDKRQIEKAYKTLKKQDYFAPKSSQLIGGYAPIHAKFEKLLCKINGFDDAMLFGSGFLANLALVSTLARRADLILMDAHYHASGIMGLESTKAKYEFFVHNNPNDLEEKLKNAIGYERVFVFVEGVYSMLGDILHRDIFDTADKYGAILVVDEAHSVGVLGERLLGVFEHYKIKPTPNHIKMGTLGKALGSYGAYVLASAEIVSFLENRARPFIYATALSLFDTTLAYHNYKSMIKNSKKFKALINDRLKRLYEVTGIRADTLIIMLEDGQNQTKKLHNILMEHKIFTGFIRPPTVAKPAIRAILRLGEPQRHLENLLSILKLHEVKSAF
jgi:8-amino-7-oxononanoate synthase